MIGKALEGRPRHDLKQVAVERLKRRETIALDGGGAVGVQVIEIGARANDQAEFRPASAARGTAGFVGREIAGHDVWSNAGDQWPEVLPAAQIDCLVDHFRRIAFEIRIAGVCVAETRNAVAPIAVCHHIDQVAPEPHQIAIFAPNIQRNRCGFKSNAYS